MKARNRETSFDYYGNHTFTQWYNFSRLPSPFKQRSNKKSWKLKIIPKNWSKFKMEMDWLAWWTYNKNQQPHRFLSQCHNLQVSLGSSLNSTQTWNTKKNFAISSLWRVARNECNEWNCLYFMAVFCTVSSTVARVSVFRARYFCWAFLIVSSVGILGYINEWHRKGIGFFTAFTRLQWMTSKLNAQLKMKYVRSHAISTTFAGTEYLSSSFFSCFSFSLA